MASQNTGRVENLKPWKPGQSGNPGGRPKGIHRRIRELYPEDELIEGMVEVARGEKIAGKTPTLREIIDARKWLADYGWGKAPSFAPIDAGDVLERDEVESALTRIADELAARREAKATGNASPRDLAPPSTNGATPA